MKTEKLVLVPCCECREEWEPSQITKFVDGMDEYSVCIRCFNKISSIVGDYQKRLKEESEWEDVGNG